MTREELDALFDMRVYDRDGRVGINYGHSCGWDGQPEGAAMIQLSRGVNHDLWYCNVCLTVHAVGHKKDGKWETCCTTYGPRNYARRMIERSWHAEDEKMPAWEFFNGEPKALGTVQVWNER